MALNTGINSLDAGAPGVRLTGDQRPQKESPFNVPEEMKMADIDNLPPWFLEDLQELLLDYEGDIGSPPRTLNDLEKWYRNKHGAKLPEKGITAAAQGGRIGFLHGSQGADASTGRTSTGGNGGDGRSQALQAIAAAPVAQPSVETRVSPGQSVAMVGNTSLAGATQSQAASVMAAASEAEGVDTIEDILAARPKIESVIGAPSGLSDITPAQADILAGVKTGDGTVMEETYGPGPLYDDTMDNEERREAELAFMFNKGLLEKDPITGEIVEGRNVRDLDTGIIGPKPKPTITTGGEGEGPIVTDTTTTAPVDTGLTTEEEAAAVAALDYGATFPTEFQEVPYKEYRLLSPVPTVTAPQISFEAARGGRAGYDRGGIAGLRQPFFLGKIAKAITKPFKKVLKSPIGKAALMYAATAGLGNIGKGAWGTPWGTAGARGWLHPATVGSNLASMFSRSPAALEKIAKAKNMSVADLSFFDKISPWKATAAITTIASVPLWARPENWDEMDSAEQEAWLRDYHSKVAAYKEEYGGKMPVGLTPASDLPHQFTAEGGRIGYAHGRHGRTIREAALAAMYGEDEEENTGIKQLFSDTWRAAKGGRVAAQEGLSLIHI